MSDSFRADRLVQQFGFEAWHERPDKWQEFLESYPAQRAAALEPVVRRGTEALNMGLQVFTCAASSTADFSLLVEGLESVGWRLEHVAAASTAGSGGTTDFGASGPSSTAIIGVFRRA